MFKYTQRALTTKCNKTSTPIRRSYTTNKHTNLVFSGIQPTGQLHLGNYLGAVQNWVKLVQDETIKEKFFCLVDMHAITVLKQGTDLVREDNRLKHHQSVLELTSTLIACGLDPEICKIYVQSHVPQHAELMWILSCHVNEARLQRMHHYKEKKAKNNEHSSVGLFIYPSLMCADILLYATKPEQEKLFIPVGDDQRQHLELSSEVAQQINSRYNHQIFSIPNALYTEAGTRVKSLRDGMHKMSKSDANENSRINLIDTPDQMVKKIRKAKTDAIAGISYNPVERPEVSNLIEIYAALSGLSHSQVCDQYTDQQSSKFKNDLAELLVSKIGAVGDEARRLINDSQYVTSILHKSAEYAQERTYPALEHVKNHMGFFPKK